MNLVGSPACLPCSVHFGLPALPLSDWDEHDVVGGVEETCARSALAPHKPKWVESKQPRHQLPITPSTSATKSIPFSSSCRTLQHARPHAYHLEPAGTVLELMSIHRVLYFSIVICRRVLKLSKLQRSSRLDLRHVLHMT